jgi:cytochrome P450/NADPH-cytochrome P450 reductase
MRETLRLSPTAPKRGITAIEDTTLGGGKYFVKAGTPILLQIWNIHRDPLIWGDDVQYLIQLSKPNLPGTIG